MREIEVGRTYRLMDPSGLTRHALVRSIDNHDEVVLVRYPDYPDISPEWVPLRWFRNG